jgi:hypothetical protein
MNSYGLEQISATIGIEDKAPTKRPYPTTRVSQHEVDNINKQFLTKLNDMVWLTRRSNLDSQRPVSHDMRAQSYNLFKHKKEQINNQNFLTIYKP